jgi:hypothetical protein
MRQKLISLGVGRSAQHRVLEVSDLSQLDLGRLQGRLSAMRSVQRQVLAREQDEDVRGRRLVEVCKELIELSGRVDELTAEEGSHVVALAEAFSSLSASADGTVFYEGRLLDEARAALLGQGLGAAPVVRVAALSAELRGCSTSLAVLGAVREDLEELLADQVMVRSHSSWGTGLLSLGDDLSLSTWSAYLARGEYADSDVVRLKGLTPEALETLMTLALDGTYETLAKAKEAALALAS